MLMRSLVSFHVLFACACAGPGDAPGAQGATSSPASASTAEPTDTDPGAGTAPSGAVPTTGGAPDGSSTGSLDPSTVTGPAAGHCGDGVLDPGEVCDDGAANGPYAGCTAQCRVNVCGDGFVYAGVEACDEGPANVDTGYCRSDCQLGVCGDGFVFAQLEECDAGAGNGPGYGACDVDCTLNRCGDGQVDVGYEECDLGADNGAGRGVEPGAAGCDLDCGLDGRRIFLSSLLFTGDMGTRAGADLACQNLAAKAGFRHPARFRALLADASGGPADFVEEDPGGRPFILPSGLIIATSYAALVADGPGAGITTTETGEVLLEKLVWTNLNPFGGAYVVDPEHTCAGWTSSSKLHASRVGYNAVSPGDAAGFAAWKEGRQWLSLAARTCPYLCHIYCIEAKAS